MLLPEAPLAPLAPLEPIAGRAAGVVVVVVVDSVAEEVRDGVVAVVVEDVGGDVALLPVVPGAPDVVSVDAMRLQPLSAALANVAANTIFNR